MKATTGFASQTIYTLQPHSAMARANCSSPRWSSLFHPDPAAVPGTRHCSFVRADGTWLNAAKDGREGKPREDKARGSPRAAGSLPVSPLESRTCSLQSPHSTAPAPSGHCSPLCSAFWECSRGILPAPSREKRHRIKHQFKACLGYKGKERVGRIFVGGDSEVSPGQ